MSCIFKYKKIYNHYDGNYDDISQTGDNKDNQDAWLSKHNGNFKYNITQLAADIGLGFITICYESVWSWFCLLYYL